MNSYFTWFPFTIVLNTLKCINNRNSFLSFKRTTQGYLVKISIAHNKYLIPLLHLLINYISATPTPQVLSLKEEYAFLF